MVPVLTIGCLHASPNLGHLTVRAIVFVAHRVHTLAVRHRHQIRLVWHDTGIHKTIRHSLVIHC